jgi:diacylglycerol kinase (ATP)
VERGTDDQRMALHAESMPPGVRALVINEVALLINPSADRGRGLRVGVEAAREFRRLGVTVDVLIGSDVSESAALAAAAVERGCRALVVCGGDGIVHTALQAVAGTTVPLGVVPAGSGNDFARALALPLSDIASAVAVVVTGRVAHVDLGRAGDRWFGTVLAAGFDSRVNDRMNRMRWPRGRTRYHVAILRELASFRPIPFVLEMDGVRRELEGMLVAVGNGSTYGGGMRICPAATLSDGLLDVTVVTTISRVKLARLFPFVYSGRHVLRPEVLTFRGESVTASAADVAGYADGECVAPLPLTCSAVRGALQIVIPT